MTRPYFMTLFAVVVKQMPHLLDVTVVNQIQWSLNESISPADIFCQKKESKQNIAKMLKIMVMLKTAINVSQ